MTAPKGAAKKAQVTYSATLLEDRLAARYRSASSEIVFGVRNDAGFSADRTADAIAIGLWPSTGCTLEGFEIKVTRGDWQRELREGSKSEAFMVHLDFWWLVAPREIVTDDELPPAWGLLCPTPAGLRIARPAKRNKKPVPMPRGMLAAFIKRASTQEARTAQLEARFQEGVAYGKQSTTNDRNYEASQYRSLREAVERFRKETGIDAERQYDLDQLRAAHALVKHGGHLALAQRLGYAANTVEELATQLRATVTSIESVTVAAPGPPHAPDLEGF